MGRQRRFLAIFDFNFLFLAVLLLSSQQGLAQLQNGQVTEGGNGIQDRARVDHSNLHQSPDAVGHDENSAMAGVNEEKDYPLEEGDYDNPPYQKEEDHSSRLGKNSDKF